MINWKQVEQLRSDIGGEGFTEVVESFILEMDEKISELSTNKNIRNIGADFHFLRGSASTLGFADFSKLCETEEKNVLLGNEEKVNIDSVIALYHKSKSEFLEKSDIIHPIHC